MKWTQAERDEYFQAHPENFAGPESSYPIKDASDVASAWGLAGHADDPAAVRAKIKAIAARLGFSHALPDTATTESAASVVDADQRPRKTIGTLKVCFLEYGARSLNGRIYPRATCDAIFKAAQKKIAQNDLPATVFVSHEAANSNGNIELVGRVARVWQEANKFYANLDLADTRAARDMLALAENGALKSESMRVAGVELKHDSLYDLPLVVVPDGTEPDFLGIDLTTRPGLADSARILQTLYESQECHVEDFTLETISIEKKEDTPPAMIPLFVQIALGMLQEAFPSKSQEAHARVHDHLAGVLDETLGARHGSESARYKSLIEGQLDEAGKAIAKKHATRLVAAHDEAAKACAMECAGCYNDLMGIPPDAGTDPANDGLLASDTDESRKENTILTEEEMLAALKAKGFTVEAPKTEKDRIADLERMLTEQAAQLKTLTETAPTQRQTLVESQLEESTLHEESLYEDGDYLKNDLHPKNWKALSNRRVAWPEQLDPRIALHEMAPFLTANLLQQEATAMGRDISAFVKPNDTI